MLIKLLNLKLTFYTHFLLNCYSYSFVSSLGTSGSSTNPPHGLTLEIVPINEKNLTKIVKIDVKIFIINYPP